MALFTLKYLTFALDWLTARAQVQDNLREIAVALSGRVTGRIVRVQRYRATGATTTQINLGVMSETPVAVLLVRAYLTSDPAADLAVSPRLNFYATPSGLGVYEPAGLIQNQSYELVFLVVEG